MTNQVGSSIPHGICVFFAVTVRKEDSVGVFQLIEKGFNPLQAVTQTITDLRCSHSIEFSRGRLMGGRERPRTDFTPHPQARVLGVRRGGCPLEVFHVPAPPVAQSPGRHEANLCEPGGRGLEALDGLKACRLSSWARPRSAPGR